jgi:hypothetical protein
MHKSEWREKNQLLLKLVKLWMYVANGQHKALNVTMVDDVILIQLVDTAWYSLCLPLVCYLLIFVHPPSILSALINKEKTYVPAT